MLFSCLVRLIIGHHTGRVRVIRHPSRQLLARHADDVIGRPERRGSEIHC
jgi:hypothetical protein